MSRGVLFTVAVVALTLVMFPLAFMLPVLAVVIGVGLGWWAGRARLSPAATAVAALAGWTALTVWHVLQHLGSEHERWGELAGSAVFVAGGTAVAWAVAAIAKRGKQLAAAGIAVAGGLAVLQLSCYAVVKIPHWGIQASPWLWYVGSMFPYGRFTPGPLRLGAEDYSEAFDWYKLSDYLVMYPAVWTFLLAFVLTRLCLRSGREVVVVQADPRFV